MSFLKDNYTILPDGVKAMMPSMLKQNWLVNYATLEGIQRVLNGMNKRTKDRSKMNFAVRELKLYYKEFEAEFEQFFVELIIFSKDKFKAIN